MNVFIDGQRVNLDHSLRQFISDDGANLMIEFPPTSVAQIYKIPLTTPGARSLWAFLQKSALVFDENTDSLLDFSPTPAGESKVTS